jgi:hypothetical protein
MPDAAAVHAAAAADAAANAAADSAAADAEAERHAASAGAAAPNRSLPKTNLCRFWRAMGSCSFGATCRFAHGSAELWQPPEAAAAAAAAPATWNALAASFAPPAAQLSRWANAQVVPVTSEAVQQYSSVAWFALPLAALALRGPHAGLHAATALLLLDVEEGVLHGVFQSVPAPQGIAHAAFACFAAAAPLGQPLYVEELTQAIPMLAAAWHGAAALSGADAARIESWMYGAEDGADDAGGDAWGDCGADGSADPAAQLPQEWPEEPWADEEEAPAQEEAWQAEAGGAGMDADADPVAALVAQHEADEALARALQAEDDAAARAAAAAPPSFASVAQRRSAAVAAAAAAAADAWAQPLPADTPVAPPVCQELTAEQLFPHLFFPPDLLP